DGDGRADIAVWRDEPSNPNKANFYILQSSTNTLRVEQFGRTGDLPTVVGDWDGDGKDDPAVYREGTSGGQSHLYYRPSSAPGTDYIVITWGTTGDKPVHGDFDGDGKLDAAVFRPSNSTWYILKSSNLQTQYVKWGLATDQLVPADFDGDQKTDVAVYRNGIWYIDQSSNGQLRAQSFGLAGDSLVPADYDGDGKADLAVVRNSIWYINQSAGAMMYAKFGATGDLAVPHSYIAP
ncbi:MAG: VCBS repeat-containing protein, partial [Acidobacteriota bacterium]